MNLRSTSALLTVLILTILGACTGGSSGAGRIPQPACGNGSNFCLVSCNLGCQVSGTCSITSIAQNQPIELTFSDLIDPATITAGSVSIKTANGEAPTGRFFVDGRKLIFVPEVRIAGGVTTFGFRAGATYVMSLNAAATGAVLSSVSGDRLARSVTCSLQVTQGLVDLDGRAPTAELVLPTATTGVSRDATIVLRFSELIDTSSFNGGSTISSPVTYQIRRTTPDPLDPNVRICEQGFVPVLIQGVPVASVEGSNPPRTVVTLQPAVQLPDRVCVEVIVTSQVRDLAGNPSAGQTFRFFTEVGTVVLQSVTESFANDVGMARDVSGGTWTGGVATPARIGGSGVLGEFSFLNGTPVPGQPNTYEIRTDNFTVPANQTLFGDQSITVTDGVFEFSKFEVPAGIRVIFRGPHPARILVRGECLIEGEVGADGANAATNFRGESTLPNTGVAGQAGGIGGAGGGDGGQGADGCSGTGPGPNFNGRPGEPATAAAASGYTPQLAGTAGPGSLLFPATGLRTSVTFALLNAISAQATSGGTGGSLFGAGEQGSVQQTFAPNLPQDRNAPAAPSTPLGFVALPGGVSSLDHFLVGGAGGGGAGSHVLNMLTSDINAARGFVAGRGGSGAGGAIAFRSGHAIEIASGARVTARGAGGLLDNTNSGNSNVGAPAMGGAGSGGTVMFQLERLTNFSQSGTIDVSGGARNTLSLFRINSTAIIHGGAGGHGAVRAEAVTAPSQTDLGTIVGPPVFDPSFVGALDPSEGDARTGCTSTWRSSRQLFAPLWRHYRLTVRVAGVPIVYSDDPQNFNPADSDTLPIQIFFQGADVNPTNGTINGEPGPWRSYMNGSNGRPSVNLDDASGFRFMLMFNRSVESDVVVEDLEVFFEA